MLLEMQKGGSENQVGQSLSWPLINNPRPFGRWNLDVN